MLPPRSSTKKKQSPLHSSDAVETVPSRYLYERMSRFPAMEIEVVKEEAASPFVSSSARIKNGGGGGSSTSNSANGDIREEVTEAGLIVTARGFVVPNNIPWTKSPRVIACDHLPKGSGLVLYPSDNRILLGQVRKDGSGYRVQLDLKSSASRDRIKIHDNMVITFFDGACEVKLRVEAAHVKGKEKLIPSYWYRKIVNPLTMEEVLNLKEDMPASEQYEFAEFAASSEQRDSEVTTDVHSLGPKKSSMRSLSISESFVPKRKSVSWGKEFDLLDGTSLDISPQPHHHVVQVEDVTALEDQTVNMLSGEPLITTIKAQYTLYINNHVVGTLDSSRRTIFLNSGGVSATPLVPTSNILTVPLESKSGGGPFLGAFTCDPETDAAFFILPRSRSSNPTIRTFLEIREDVLFPLQADDSFRIADPSGKIQFVELHVNIPLLSRGVPKSADDTVNDHQFLNDLGVETKYQSKKGKTPPEVMERILPKSLFSFGKQVKIGRGECEVVIGDPHLSRIHASISRVDNKQFILHTDADRKATFLLLGKDETYYRPPSSLRSGDIFCLGRSELKVVYQQRGDRILPKMSNVMLEIEKRCATDQGTINFEMTIGSDSWRTMSSTAGIDVSHSDIVSVESGATTGGGDRRSPFDKMDSAAEGACIRPTFKDVPSMMSYFGIKSLGDGPVMILESISGPEAHRFFMCSPLETIIGSSKYANVSIQKDRRMSPMHARVYFCVNRGRWVLEDLNSQHGTFLRISHEDTLLCAGDVFLMGLSLVKFFGVPLKTMSSSSSKNCKMQ